MENSSLNHLTICGIFLLGITTNREAGEVICIFDALDECQDADRKQLIRALSSLYSKRLEAHNLKFLVTSRPYDHIRRGFQGLKDRLPMIHLSGEEEAEIEKISHEIDLVIQKRVEDIGKENHLRPDECVFLQNQLTSVPNRTYLWVSLTLDVIENMPGFTKGRIRHAIRNLPQNVDEAYDKILNRSPDKLNAKRLLHIVTGAQRPLSLREVSIAMTVDAGLEILTELEDELIANEKLHDRRFQRTMRELCGLFLVTVDEKVYLLHQTAKEFLVQNNPLDLVPLSDPSQSVTTWKHFLQPKASHEVLAVACMLYLSYDGIANRFPWLHSFFTYAACHWPSHFREAFTQDAHQAAKLGYAICQAGSYSYENWSLVYGARFIDFPTFSNTLIIATFFGLAAVAKLQLQNSLADIDPKDDAYGRTPLSWAASNGYEEVVKLLLETQKVDPDSKDDKNGRTPLSYASSIGQDAVVKLLLGTQKVDVNSRDAEFGQTPLTWAAEKWS
ncbi:hypothetical protein BJX63DRAFT_432174 [Aspergillus granulosus]|uniref:Uncharacterized protein n=1 Tax=Aspergillus granulosus TaxID=176169 RepID=A0ABR4HCD0_9EURO